MTITPAASAKPRANKLPPRAAPALSVSDRTIGGLTEVFKLLADKSRLKILLALAREGEMHVSALCELLEQSQPAVSHHLTLLRAHHLVDYRRDGKHNYYRIDSALVRDLLQRFFSDAGGRQQLHFDEFSLVFKPK